jgi:hypothetical protein
VFTPSLLGSAIGRALRTTVLTARDLTIVMVGASTAVTLLVLTAISELRHGKPKPKALRSREENTGQPSDFESERR